MQHSQKGLSLIELMVAMAIGLFLLLGVSKIFLDSKRTYSFQQSLARIQENGRMAQEFMGRDIRMAGYTGCASGDYSSITNTLNNSTTLNYDFSRGIRGYDVGASVPSDLSALSPAPLINTDVLVLKGPVGDGVNVVGNKGSDANIEVKVISSEPGACADASERVSGICAGDILMVADCTKARVFQATNTQKSGSPQTLKIVHSATGTPGNLVSSWGGNGANAFPEAMFDTDAEIIKMNTVYYYIATGASGQPALWQAIVPGIAAQEILEGVESLQLIYGRDTNSDLVPDRYETATAVTTANAWDKVGAIRIQLLMRSVEANVTDAAQPYSFNGVDVTPTDKRLRHVFVSTIGVRAKMP
ncbi:MAG TPA: PilW family protein [Pseudomonas sp.]|uniref:PilW family protein n=1 Tax=Pseudomonas sp. TaxID=306 RepID=UPI002C5C0869|nr:PilW family protein [Pseudomonas sp.]HRL92206.1 PilW family protein [Pseudomonas sp.]